MPAAVHVHCVARHVGASWRQVVKHTGRDFLNAPHSLRRRRLLRRILEHLRAAGVVLNSAGKDDALHNTEANALQIHHQHVGGHELLLVPEQRS